jgi:Fic family protein
MQGARGERFATPGEFRNIQNHIGGSSNHPAEARFVPPPPDVAMSLMDQFFDYLRVPKADTPILVEAAWMHYQFEAIHPFLDGNGRVGRVLIPLLLAHRNQLEHPLLYLSPYFERDRTRYYDALMDVSTRSAWAGWLEYFLRGVVDQAQAGTDLATRMIELGAEWRRRLDAVRAARSAHRLAEHVQEVIGIDSASAKNFLGVSPQTAYKAIDTLVACGIITEVTGRSWGQFFMATELQEMIETGL